MFLYDITHFNLFIHMYWITQSSILESKVEIHTCTNIICLSHSTEQVNTTKHSIRAIRRQFEFTKPGGDDGAGADAVLLTLTPDSVTNVTSKTDHPEGKSNNLMGNKLIDK